MTADGPRLVVLVAVDQFPYEYLARFDSLLVGGLRRLLDQGVLFENARYGHGVTVTAPGHTTLASGLHPSSSGIVDNYWYDRDAREQVYSFGDAVHERSPDNFLGTAFPDWLKGGVDPGARVFAVSGKDRAAIAMAGHRPDGAFWYDDSNGGFETSTYYGAELPDWVRAWNDQRRAVELVRARLRAAPAGARERRRARPPGAGRGRVHAAVSDRVRRQRDRARLRASSRTSATRRCSTSWSSRSRARIVERQELGRRDHLDYLAIGLSSLDLAGHRYGPPSPQVADTLLRVDRELGDFLTFLDRTVGKDRFVVALTSDHGVAPIPEQRMALGLPAQRPDVGDQLCFQQAGERVRQRFGLEQWVLEGFYLDRAAIRAAGADLAEVATATARELETCDIVERVWTAAELDAPAADSEQEPFRTSIATASTPIAARDLMIQLVEYAIPAGLVATHGSPYDYDRHVPVFVMAPGIGAARIADEVGVVDLAPTLAGLLGISTPKVDGRDLTGLLLEKVPGAKRLPAFAATSAADAPSTAAR